MEQRTIEQLMSCKTVPSEIKKQNKNLEAILIAGPTASGKSALAIKLAQQHNGVVVNADSMQVYADLRAITARPSPEEEMQTPHLMYGHVDASINYSVGRWLEDISNALQSIWSEKKIPIIVGGTGLYFKALTEGLSEIPPVPDHIRQEIRQKTDNLEATILHAQLTARDPETAQRIKPNDRQRTLRALEVFEATGKSLTSFHKERKPGLLTNKYAKKIFLAPQREELNNRINNRFLDMMRNGAEEEVRKLAQRELDPSLPAMRAHGVPWIIQYMQGGISLDQAIANAQADTRHYAKRQFTWFRHQIDAFEWISPGEAKNVL